MWLILFLKEIVFALGQLCAEMPYSLLCAVVFFVLLYYPMGLNKESSRAGYQVCSAGSLARHSASPLTFQSRSSSWFSSPSSSPSPWVKESPRFRPRFTSPRFRTLCEHLACFSTLVYMLTLYRHSLLVIVRSRIPVSSRFADLRRSPFALRLALCSSRASFLCHYAAYVITDRLLAPQTLLRCHNPPAQHGKPPPGSLLTSNRADLTYDTVAHLLAHLDAPT